MRSPLLRKKSVSPVRQGDLGALCQTVLGIVDFRKNIGTGKAPEEHREAYESARHKLRELYRGTLQALPRNARRLIAEARYAKWDLRNSDEYALSGSYAMAVQGQFYAALKMRSILSALRQGKVSAQGTGAGALRLLLEEVSRALGNDDDRRAYIGARAPFEQLMSGLSRYPNSARRLRRARQGQQAARSFASVGDYGSAVSWLLDAADGVRAFLGLHSGKLAYGYDISGEIGEVWHGTEDLANRENQKNIDDTAQPFEQHETTPNPANVTRDYQAERDYPSLAERKSRRVHWPPRLR
jgi:hypothetical protein